MSDERGTESLREIRELVKKLSEETATLIRQEIQLAKAELAEKGKKVGLGAGMFGAAGIMGLLTAGAFTSLLILVLALFTAPWLAALIVTGLYGAATAALGLTGKKRIQEATPLVPSETIDAAKSAVSAVKAAKDRF